jgi:hypothetical protein
VARSDALALHEELRQIHGASVGHGPLPILNAECRLLLLALVCLGWRLGLATLLAFLTSRLFLDFNDLRLWEYLVFNLVLINILFLGFVLEPNDGLHLSYMLLNHKELVHEP